jgi:ribosomal-protein-alanine N-acetyltransferase
MSVSDLGRVLAVEVQAYSFPWSRGNFSDSLSAGYTAELLERPQDGALLGYYLAMAGVDELHLLNLTVAPAHQGQGLAHRLMDRLETRARELGMASLWLEVRAGNARARALYRRRGYAEVGLRRGYYPAAGSRREDAVVMSRAMQSGPGAATCCTATAAAGRKAADPPEPGGAHAAR